MGASFRKMTGRKNKAERRQWRKDLAIQEWLEDIKKYRRKFEEDEEIEKERLGIFLLSLPISIHVDHNQLYKRSIYTDHILYVTL